MAGEQHTTRYVLRLYNANRTDEMRELAKRFEEIMSAYCPGEHRVEVVDVLAEPEQAAGEQVFVTPTLVKALPEPVRRVIGDMSDPRRILLLLGVLAIDEEPGGADDGAVS